MINFEQTIISQYDDSATIVGLIKGINENIDPRADLQTFYDYAWNVETAQGFGLDNWGKIVGVGREIRIPSTLNYFGFDEGVDYFPFNDEPFYTADNATEVYRLSDDAYRVLILTKALANISRTNAASLNRLLMNLFPDRGRTYVLDTGSMTMRYVFDFQLEPFELAIVSSGNVLPRPAGVLASVVSFPSDIFGFAEAGNDWQPFDQGTFFV
jgi:hypothetical protein